MAAFLRLRAHLRANRYDLVHTHTSKAGVLGRLAACRPWVVPRFSAAVMVDKIEDIYLRLLSGNVRGARAAG